MSPDKTATTAKSCKICGLPTRFTNFGVVSCRACANFFKRTHLLGKYYVCRQSTGECGARRDVPFLCRRCRFDKCVALGMQLPEGLISQSKSRFTNLCTNTQEFVLPSILDEAHSNSIVQKMERQFNFWYERRRQMEMELWNSHQYGYNEVRSPGGSSGTFLVGTNIFANDSYRTIRDDTIQMYGILFPEFRELSTEDKNTVFVASANAAYNLYCYYFSEKYFPGNDRYVLISPTSLLDIERPESFMLGVEDHKIDAMRVMLSYSMKYNEQNRPIIRNARLTNIEFYAAQIILSWSFELAPWVPEHVVKIGEKIKEKVYKELDRYYKNELKCTDIALRLGQLMLCVYAMQEATVMMQEEFQTYKLLGSIKENDSIMKLVLG